MEDPFIVIMTTQGCPSCDWSAGDLPTVQVVATGWEDSPVFEPPDDAIASQRGSGRDLDTGFAFTRGKPRKPAPATSSTASPSSLPAPAGRDDPRWHACRQRCQSRRGHLPRAVRRLRGTSQAERVTSGIRRLCPETSQMLERLARARLVGQFDATAIHAQWAGAMAAPSLRQDTQLEVGHVDSR